MSGPGFHIAEALAECAGTLAALSEFCLVHIITTSVATFVPAGTARRRTYRLWLA